MLPALPRAETPASARNRPWDVAIVVLFAVLIALPLTLNLAGADGGDPGAENRDLAPMPRLAPDVASLAGFGSGFIDWFDDHFGLRSALVRWYGESRLFALGVSPSSAVVRGRDGWLFYADDGGMQDYTNEQPLSPLEVDLWRETLDRTHAWLAARGIAYVFTIAPDKHVFYGDEVPPAIRRVGAVSRTDQVYAALDGVPWAVDLRPALREATARERTFWKTDTHWNERGAFAAYQQIIGAVRLQAPGVPAAWPRDRFTPRTARTAAGDLAGMIGLKRVLRETDLTLAPTLPRAARVVEPAGAPPDAEEGRLVTEIPGSSLPRAVIFRDSFASRLAPFLSEHFSRAVYLWQNDFDPGVVERERPDVVIQEIVGRHLYTFLPSPELVPK